MQIAPISSRDFINYNMYRQNRVSGVNYHTSFQGTKGLILGAVTGGVIASFFTDMFMVYAAIGGIIGDLFEEINNNNNDKDSSQSNQREKNFRAYS